MEIKKITLAYYLRTNRSNDIGQHQVYLRFTKNRSPRLIGMGLLIFKNEWKGKKGEYLDRSCKSINKDDWNRYLTSKMAHAEKIVLMATLKEIELEFDSFKEAFFNPDFNFRFSKKLSRSYIDFYQIYEEVKQSKIKQGVEDETIKNYIKECNRIKRFSKEIDVNEIDHEWLDNIQHYFRTELNNGNNTIHRTLLHIKMVIDKAIKDRLIIDNPFEFYELPKIKTAKRQFLTKEELEEFHQLYISNVLTESYQNVLKQFLSACYLGFDYGCMSKIKCSDIKCENGIYCLEREREKNSMPYLVPITEKAATIIDLKNIIGKEGLIFRSISNQKTNEYLRDIARKLEIKGKRVTFHVARHTFGTRSVNKGVPLEAIQKMMGHSSIKQTQYYARISKKFALNFFDKLNT